MAAAEPDDDGLPGCCSQSFQLSDAELNRSSDIAAERLTTAAVSFDRFSRLSTDLANERTLLAWIRTAMAGMRTAFAYIGMEALEGTGWAATFWASRLSMITVVLVGTLSGIRRYQKIKQATYAVDPPVHFGRVSVYYFFYLLAASVATMTIGCYFDAWGKM